MATTVRQSPSAQLDHSLDARVRAIEAQVRALDTRSTGIQPRLMRRAGAAAYLGVSLRALDLLRVHGDVCPITLPSRRRNGEALRAVMYDVRDLDAWIDQCKEESR
jgi:hypothetical protein